jgi:hypothetical protein
MIINYAIMKIQAKSIHFGGDVKFIFDSIYDHRTNAIPHN